MAALITELREAREAAGLSQAAVAAALRCSRPLVDAWERRRRIPRPVQLSSWAAAVGLDVPLRAYAGGSPVHDDGHLRVIKRLLALAGRAWRALTEVPVSAEPLDRRAVDVVLTNSAGRIGGEVITKLVNAQAQVRSATLKQQAAGLDRMILALPDTRHNRMALAIAAPSIVPAFPLSSRAVGYALRHGQLPRSNGVLIL